MVLPSGNRLAPGDEVEAGGGYHSIGDLAAFVIDVAAIDKVRDCSDRTNARTTFVIQHPVDA